MILSICIPSYDRFEKLKETVEEILKAKSTDFEVVIVDNCSPRDIYDYISFDDPRLRIIKRDKPVSGEKSVEEAVLYGSGEYSLLLLDKDTIISDGIDSLTEDLKNSDVMGGRCVLNSNGNSAEIVEKDRIVRFGYLSIHPSGTFYRTDIVREYMNSKNLDIENTPHNFVMYSGYCASAYCASLGKMMSYDKPCVCSGLMNLTGDDPRGTFTYLKERGNLFYLPEIRIEAFKIYISSLNELEAEKDERIGVCTRLYMQTLQFVTTDYRTIMRNPGLCHHYHHQTENIGLFKMLRYAADFRRAFYEVDCKDVTKKDKGRIERTVFKQVVYRIYRRLQKTIKGRFMKQIVKT